MDTIFVFFFQLISFFQPTQQDISLPQPTSAIAVVTQPMLPSPTIMLVPIDTPTPLPTPIPINTLLRVVNQFREMNNQPSLLNHSHLCSIAARRINALVERGSLDNHEGYIQYNITLGQYFTEWWETLFFGSPSKSSHEVIFNYWANSTGHKDSLLSSATHGCGAEKKGFAVFELGKIK